MSSVQTADAADVRFQQEKRKPEGCTGAAFWYYNFARIHSSLRITPAMAGNVTDRVWTLEDLAAYAT